MNVNKLAGAALIVLAVVNVLHAIVTSLRGPNTPGVPFALVTATLFTVGVWLLMRKSRTRSVPKAKGPSIFEE